MLRLPRKTRVFVLAGAAMAFVAIVVSSHVHDSKPLITRSSLGTYDVGYVSRPSPIPLNEIFELTISIRDARSPGLALRSVRVHAEMPEHNHGMNTRPAVVQQAGGAYRVEGMLFHMAGRWTISVDLEREDAITERAAFDVRIE